MRFIIRGSNAVYACKQKREKEQAKHRTAGLATEVIIREGGTKQNRIPLIDSQHILALLLSCSAIPPCRRLVFPLAICPRLPFVVVFLVIIQAEVLA